MKTRLSLALGWVVFLSNPIYAQDFQSIDYEKALWMTTRFYGAQRASDTNHPERVNWVLYNHLPSGVPANLTGQSFASEKDPDNGHDVSGGWFDCGDHVKFGQTQYYSAYMILKAYDEFKEGFRDYYSENFMGYGNTGDWTWEGNQGQPNGIPDILDELRHATDFFIKCSPDNNTFYFEIGNGSYDHQNWVTSVEMQTYAVNQGGAPRPIYKNPSDGCMPSFSAATLALMARSIKPFDPAYSAKCMKYAKHAYNYALQNIGNAEGAASGGFYPPNSNSKNAWAIAICEMFMATGDSTYIEQLNLLSVPGDVSPNSGYTYDYSNNGEMALYVMASLGHTTARAQYNGRIENHWLSGSNYNSEVIYDAGGSWGKLRYVANAGYLIALYDKLNGNATLNPRVYDNIDYILGSNNGKQSFITGYRVDTSYKMPLLPHHRNAYLNDNNVPNGTLIYMPTKNEQLGALVGGTLTSTSFVDDRDDFVDNEVCIDYNAGLVGALAAIQAELLPVDTMTFINHCAKTNIGGNKYLCSGSPLTIDTKLSLDNNRTFEWFRNDTSLGAPSSSATTLSVTSPGTYTVILDSSSVCYHSETIEVLNEVPDFDFGPDFQLCYLDCVKLETKISGDEVNIQWYRDGLPLTHDLSYYDVADSGLYIATASLSGCMFRADTIQVGSSLPEVIDGTFCTTGTATLGVVGSGTYNWYDSPVSNSPIHTGSSFTTPTLSYDKTYYVVDVGNTVDYVVGLDATSHGLTNSGGTGNPDEKAIEFDALTNITITGLNFERSGPPCGWGPSESLQFQIENSVGSIVTSTNVSVPCGGGMQVQDVTFNTPLVVPAGTGYKLQIPGFNFSNPATYRNSAGNNPYPYTEPGVITVTGPHPSLSGTSYEYGHPGFYDLKISVGEICIKSEVKAIDTCNVISAAEVNDNVGLDLYPNPAFNATWLSKESEWSLFNAQGILLKQDYGTMINVEDLASGLYILKTGSRSFRLIKE